MTVNISRNDKYLNDLFERYFLSIKEKRIMFTKKNMFTWLEYLILKRQKNNIDCNIHIALLRERFLENEYETFCNSQKSVDFDKKILPNLILRLSLLEDLLQFYSKNRNYILRFYNGSVGNTFWICETYMENQILAEIIILDMKPNINNQNLECSRVY